MGNQTSVGVTTLHPRLRALESSFGLSTLSPIIDPALSSRQIQLWIKRDDLLHPVISGNKWRKLKYLLNEALVNGADTLVSMGGAYSNHLHALAFAGKYLGLKTIGYVRGEPPEIFNPTLQDLKKWGMTLHFVPRSAYRELRAYKNNDLPGLSASQYWVPEGGANSLALKGVAEIAAEMAIDFDHLLVACGTGTTLAGLISAVPAHCRVTGVAALKGAAFLNDEVKQLLPQNQIYTNWQIVLDYHFGGFAKSPPELRQFMRQFYASHRITLESVYTGKLLFAVFDLLQKGYFKPGQRIVAVHTGGLQGARSLSGLSFFQTENPASAKLSKPSSYRFSCSADLED
ncbi:1-aminocyclopropane-1-carboxylate deaminase [Methylomonas methanica MC09]|uniref:1-aminocyclopropane-1-carboxylate deaminase n=1 Tax=Methylomonas methanica (strain DSM 25384 / MC09) TaxID=857087 RepID=F9ZYA2_METMM|nr:1-aminocyclopropane-1-carboxylate deaminase [Methylomonas methanica MC09]